VQGTLGLTQKLPAKVDVAGTATAVTWDEASAAQPRAQYAKLTVTGRLTESGQPVVAAFEVVPSRLVYYIDSGTNGVDSPQYTAVKKSVPTLRNDKIDQVSTAADQWGYVADGMKVKGTTDINDKYSTGFYQDTTKLIYRLPLDAGTYTLTGGFTEWWNVSRSMYQTVSVGGVELAKGSVPLSGSSSPIAADLTFTLDAPATVEYLVTNEGAGAEKPVISWLAVQNVTPLADLSVATRCVAGKVVAVATVANKSDAKLSASLATPWGAKQIDDLAVGKTTSFAFTTRQASIPAGELTLTLPKDASGSTPDPVTASFDAFACR